MLSNEEFKRTYIRMMDSLRDPLDPNLKGRADCKGVCCDCCPLYKLDDRTLSPTCSNMTYRAMDVIEIVEQWGKDHPIMTNIDKYKEVFGVTPNCVDDCPPVQCPINSDSCKTKVTCGDCRRKYWYKEYIPPKED